MDSTLPLYNNGSSQPQKSAASVRATGVPLTSDSKAHRRGRLPRNGHDYGAKVSLEEILKATQQHISYTWNSTTLTGLDKYADCGPYGIVEAEEQKLVAEEVERLVNVAKSSEPLLFGKDNKPGPTASFAPDMRKAFEEVACIADQIRCAMGIIRLDNARISIEHSTELDESIHAFRQARRRLRGRFHTNESQVRGSAPKCLEPPLRNIKLYFQVVEFATAYVARLLVRTAVSSYWNQQIFSCLAACTAKIKVLSRHTERHAEKCISTADRALEDIKSRDASKESFVVKLRVSPDDPEKDVDTVDMETDASRVYHEEKTRFHHEIFWLIRRVLANLLMREDQMSDPDSFEVFTSLYSARIDGLPTILTSDRVGEISLSSSTFHVQSNHTVMTMLFDSLKVIQARHPNSTPLRPSKGSKDDRTRIKCQWMPCTYQKKLEKFDIMTNDIEEIVSVLVPLAFCSVPATSSLVGLVTAAGIHARDKDPVLRFEQPHRACQGYVRLRTAAWETKQEELAQQNFRDAEIAMLPEVSANFGDPVHDKRSQATVSEAHKFPFKQTQSLIESYRTENSKMTRWIISESAVTVNCFRYTWATIAIAAVILCAGLSVPFTVQDKLPGVDPFNITLFAWLIAGLALIFAKGRYVSEWPWHEFIHGHVVCRTVKELCDVSGIDSEVVIMYLLLNEWRTSLRTEGPFNGMFTRRVLQGSGFAINKPTHISTLAASGFLLLKVINVAGEHIICLDARRGSDYVSPRSVTQRLVFPDLEEHELEQEMLIESTYGDDRDGDETINPAKQLRRERILVDRVLGAYIGDSFFG